MNHGREIIKLINKHAVARRGWELFRDWVVSMAIAFQSSMSTGTEKDELEEQYEKIRERNGDEIMQDYGKALGMLTAWLEEYPHDALGRLFMMGEWGATEWGQFFTPPEVSELVARLNMGRDEAEATINQNGFIRLHEPAAGAGGLIIEFSKILKEWGFNPQKHLHVDAIELDRDVALMNYVQLTLLHIPARIFVGNTLTLKADEVFYTPAHIMGLWSAKLNRPDAVQVPVGAQAGLF